MSSDDNGHSEESSEEESADSTPLNSGRGKRKRVYKVLRQKFPFLSRNLGKPSECSSSIPTSFEIYWINKRGNLSRRIEIRGDQKCPFCGFAAGSAKRLLKHCRRFHSDHHFFTSVKGLDGALNIHAKPIHLADAGTLISLRNFNYFRFRGSPSDGKRVKMTKPYSTDVVVKSITSVLTKEQQSMAATAQAPRRQYYHSRSRVPMQPGEWAVDSDDESDCDWLNELGEAGLNEFVDVTAGEKRFLDLWKRFVRSDTILVDEKMPIKCIEFIRSHRRELDGLRQQLLQHLMVFWEHKLMPSSHILTCMAEYDSLNSHGGLAV